MLIAIATENGHVSPHFGRCQQYTLFDVAHGVIQSKRVVPNPGHEPGVLPAFLKEIGASCIIAGGMGPRAQQLFDQQGIDVVMGVSGKVEDIANAFLAGELTGQGNACDHGHPEACDRH
jgi:predicted Fe-Mo cluster-binding NifX family protein